MQTPPHTDECIKKMWRGGARMALSKRLCNFHKHCRCQVRDHSTWFPCNKKGYIKIGGRVTLATAFRRQRECLDINPNASSTLIKLSYPGPVPWSVPTNWVVGLLVARWQRDCFHYPSCNSYKILLRSRAEGAWKLFLWAHSQAAAMRPWAMQPKELYPMPVLPDESLGMPQCQTCASVDRLIVGCVGASLKWAWFAPLRLH